MNQLAALAIKHGTDKWGSHYYCDIYQSYFDKLKDKHLTFLEMGFGGYEYPDRGGGSMKMWAEYFTNPGTNLYVSDIYDKNMEGFDERISFVKVDPRAFTFDTLRLFTYDIIIDDASHHNQEIINAFNVLFPVMRTKGIYVVEDTHASYWEVPAHEGTKDLRGAPESSSMNYFKFLADCLNDEHLPDRSVVPAIAKDILSIHFYEKIIFILKK